MTEAGPTIDLNDFIDGRVVRTSTIAFLTVATLAMLGDGFDLAAMGLVGRNWSRTGTSPRPNLPRFSRLGWSGCSAPHSRFAGDNFGRKTMILVSLCIWAPYIGLHMGEFGLSVEVLRFLT